LNYRLEASREKVLNHIEANEFPQLLAADQLRRERIEKRAFDGFEEENLFFRPTYKYTCHLRDEDGHRIYTDEKQRVPSWCDRVLWRKFPNTYLEIEEYNCVDAITTSDHSPVYATFKIGIRLAHSFLKLQKPFAPQSTGPSEEYYCYFYNLRGDNLWVITTTKKRREPNPYVKFVAPFLPQDRKSKSKVLFKTTNPFWGDVRPFRVTISEKKYLETQHIFVVVMSEVEVGNNIRLGQGILSVKGFCGPDPLEFTVPIYRHGKQEGQISGSAQIRIGPPA